MRIIYFIIIITTALSCHKNKLNINDANCVIKKNEHCTILKGEECCKQHFNIDAMELAKKGYREFKVNNSVNIKTKQCQILYWYFNLEKKPLIDFFEDISCINEYLLKNKVKKGDVTNDVLLKIIKKIDLYSELDSTIVVFNSNKWNNYIIPKYSQNLNKCDSFLGGYWEDDVFIKDICFWNQTLSIISLPYIKTLEKVLKVL
jgi:hypothetical protein